MKLVSHINIQQYPPSVSPTFVYLTPLKRYFYKLNCIVVFSKLNQKSLDINKFSWHLSILFMDHYSNAEPSTWVINVASQRLNLFSQ